MTHSNKERLITSFVKRARRAQMIARAHRGLENINQILSWQRIRDTFMECARAVKIWI